MKCFKCNSENTESIDILNRKFMCKDCDHKFSIASLNLPEVKLTLPDMEIFTPKLEIPESFREISKQALMLAKTYSWTEDITKDWRESIFKSIKPMLDIYKRASLISEGFAESIASLRKKLKEHDENTEGYILLMQAVGYPPDSNIQFEEAKILNDIYQDYQNETLTEEEMVSLVNFIIEEIYSEEVIQYIGLEWEDSGVVDSRLMLLRQALRAHNLGMYSLSITSLITQLEGIVAEAFKISSYLSQKSLVKLINELFEDKNRYSKSLKEFYLDQVLANFRHGDEIKFELQRHAILHGASSPEFFASKETSLKVILLLRSIIREVYFLTDERVRRAKDNLK